MENSDKKILRGITYGITGNSHDFTNWYGPLIGEISMILKDEGYNESINNAPEGYETKSTKPKAIDVQYELYIKIVLFLGNTLATLVAEEALKAIIKKIAEAAKNKLSKKEFSGGISMTLIDVEDFSVSISGSAKSEQDVDDLQTSTIEATNRACIWQQTNKTTSKTLVYKVKNGTIADEVIVS